MSNFFNSFFQEGSRRSEAGLGFQKKAFEEFKKLGVEVQTIEEWLHSMDPELTNKQIWALEKTWGDLVLKTKKGSHLFIECVTSSGDRTPFPESKIKMFSGSNKWYLFGWDDERHFVPSDSWNSYAGKIQERVQREHDTVVIVKRNQYSSMRCGTKGLEKFCKERDLV